MRFVPRPRWIAVWLSVMAALWGQPALAADTGHGSKNFRAPASVPNYFSNEAGPMLGGAAESRRGELYGAPGATAAPPQRPHVAMAVPQRAPRVEAGRARLRSAIDRHGGTNHHIAHVEARGRVTHAKSSSHVAAHTSPRHGATHATSKATPVGSNRHHGRG